MPPYAESWNDLAPEIKNVVKTNLGRKAKARLFNVGGAFQLVKGEVNSSSFITPISEVTNEIKAEAKREDSAWYVIGGQAGTSKDRPPLQRQNHGVNNPGRGGSRRKKM